MTCPDCKGKGTITLLTTADPCAKCGGAGSINVIALGAPHPSGITCTGISFTPTSADGGEVNVSYSFEFS